MHINIYKHIHIHTYKYRYKHPIQTSYKHIDPQHTHKYESTTIKHTNLSLDTGPTH
jgi:hypothetical protein